MKNPSHAKYSRKAKRTVRNIEHFFGSARIYPRGHIFLDKVVLAHVSKALKVAQAVICLVDTGYPEEAFGLSRTLVEVAFNLRFITNKDSERRAQRFVEYFARYQLENIRRAVKHFRHSKTELRKRVPHYARLVKAARKFPDRTSWTRTLNRKASSGGVWKMAMEPDRYENINGKPLRWEFDYDWIYFWTSQYVHATVACMNSHAVLPRQPFSVHIAPRRDEDTAGLAVFNTVLYLYKVLVMAFRAIKHDFPLKLSHSLETLLHDMAHDKG